MEKIESVAGLMHPGVEEANAVRYRRIGCGRVNVDAQIEPELSEMRQRHQA
jgi:hypothetical protein